MVPPELKVTMLGAPGSGKTTYLHGMYAVLSGGLPTSGSEVYSLFTPDLDDDLRLMRVWDAVCAGKPLPPPNASEVPVTYPLVFRRNLQTVLAFSWEDYRGGALNEEQASQESVDVGPLLARLAESSTVFLVLSGAELIQPVTQANVWRFNGDRTLARRMSAVLGQTISGRQSRRSYPPSIVVLVTKSDLIRDANPGVKGAEIMDMICASVQQLLPTCFVEEATTAICPIQIGSFGQAMQDTVDPAAVDPRNLHFPLIFSFLSYLDSYLASIRQAIDTSQAAAHSHRDDARRVSGGLLRIFRSGRIAELNRLADSSDRTVQELTGNLVSSQKDIDAMRDALQEGITSSKIAVFSDGIRVS